MGSCPGARAGWHAATLSEMGSEAPSGLALSQVRMACGRIVGVAQAIARVYRLQAASEGTLVPWTEEYHRMGASRRELRRVRS